jgi:hypothetical protein
VKDKEIKEGGEADKTRRWNFGEKIDQSFYI